MMHTERYCDTLDALDKAKAIRAIHEAWLQLSALAPVAKGESYDNAPALASLSECLADAGHLGFSA